MSKKSRKCDSDKYRRHQRKAHVNHLAKVERRREIEREDSRRRDEWRKNQELIREKERELIKRIANLLSFRIWQLDPVKYDYWVRQGRIRSIMNVFGGNYYELLRRLDQIF